MGRFKEHMGDIDGDFKQVFEDISELEEARDVMKEAGEPTTEIQSQIDQMRAKANRWQRAFAKKGLL